MAAEDGECPVEPLIELLGGLLTRLQQQIAVLASGQAPVRVGDSASAQSPTRASPASAASAARATLADGAGADGAVLERHEALYGALLAAMCAGSQPMRALASRTANSPAAAHCALVARVHSRLLALPLPFSPSPTLTLTLHTPHLIHT